MRSVWRARWRKCRRSTTPASRAPRRRSSTWTRSRSTTCQTTRTGCCSSCTRSSSCRFRSRSGGSHTSPTLELLPSSSSWSRAHAPAHAGPGAERENARLTRTTMRLKDKVAIITGGGQGIGREYALRFAREGAKVVIGDIREAQAKEVIQEIKDLGGDGLALRTDVSKEEDTKRLADTTHEHFGRIDILLNNAAIFYDMDLNDRSLEYFNKILSVNLTGVWLCTRAVETYMKRQRKGKIIHQSSTAAYMGNAGVVDTSDPELPSPAPHYSVTKIGVSGLTKYMAGYLGPWGINVNTICPGLTLTEAAKRIVPEDMMSMLPMFTALKRPLQPQDLTGTVVFLASEDNDMMTGQVLVVDGGMIMLG